MDARRGLSIHSPSPAALGIGGGGEASDGATRPRRFLRVTKMFFLTETEIGTSGQSWKADQGEGER
jgi:hypothetical protein